MSYNNNKFHWYTGSQLYNNNSPSSFTLACISFNMFCDKYDAGQMALEKKGFFKNVQISMHAVWCTSQCTNLNRSPE